MELQTRLLEHTNQLVTASNFAVAGVLFIIGTIILVYIRKIEFSDETDLVYMLTGVVIEAYGWCIHRIYSGAWLMYHLYGDTSTEKMFEDNAYLLLIPVIMIMVGMSMILGPVIAIIAKFKNRLSYFSISFLFILSLWWFSYWKIGDAFEVSKHQKTSETEMIKFSYAD